MMKTICVGCMKSAAMAVAFMALPILITLSAPAAHAQVAGATLSGLVADESGAVVAGAKVAINNPSSGTSRDVITNANGLYTAPNLLPGSYEVTVVATGFTRVVQSGLTLSVGSQLELNFSLKVGAITETVEVRAVPPSVQTGSSTMSATVDSTTVRELPLNGRDWTSLATLEPGVVSIPNQATASFSANKGNRGFGNQLSNSGHRANENAYRVNGISINDYSNAAPGGATGVNLGVDAIQEFSVLTNGYTAEYGRTSGAVITAITKSGNNEFHGTAFGFDRNSVFDARNFFDKAIIPPFRRVQYGAAAGGPIVKNRTFIFGAYEGIRQSSSSSGTIRVPDAASRAQAVPAIVPYLALWPVAPAGAPDVNGIQTINVSVPNSAHENYFTTRVDHKQSDNDTLAFSYFFDSGPQAQSDPLGNTEHLVFSRRQTITAEETHVFSPQLLNVVRAGFSRVIGDINAPSSGDAVATDKTLAIAPGALAPPQIPVSGLTTAYGLGGFNQFKHAWNSLQFYDDAFLNRGTHAIKFGFAFERMQYNVLEQLSPNGRTNSYPSLAAFLSNAPIKLNALAPGGSHEVGFRESLFAGYVHDDWRVRPNLTVNIGLRYEMTTRPTNSTTVPGYTVSGYTVATANFQQIVSLSNCASSIAACAPVGLDSPIQTNPTKFNFEPRFGFAWDPFKDGKTSVRGGFAMFDVLPLPYEFGLNTSATAPFQIIGADSNARLGTGVPDPNISFNPLAIRNRYIDAYPKRADVLNWNVNIQREIAPGWTALAAYVASRSIHLSVAADDINLVPATAVQGIGFVLPCNPSALTGTNTCATQLTGVRINPVWGGGAGIRPVIYDGTSTYRGFQGQLKRSMVHGLQGQISYTYGKCRDRSSAPVTGDTYLNSIAVPLLLATGSRAGPCDFDIRQVTVGSLIWQLPSPKSSSKFVSTVTGGWEIGSLVTRMTGAPFTATTGGGSDPLGTGFNGDYSMDFANVLPGCSPINGGVNYLNRNCFTPPTAPTSFGAATAANPYGCAPNSFLAFPSGAPSGQQFCSNVLGNVGRNSLYGPGLANWDLSVFKNTRIRKISEAANLQFRAEFFNVLNHTNFLSPGFLNTFGQNNSLFDVNGKSLPTALNQTSTTSRQIQFGLKMVW